MRKDKWEIFKKSAYNLLDPIVGFFAKIGLTPNGITLLLVGVFDIPSKKVLKFLLQKK